MKQKNSCKTLLVLASLFTFSLAHAMPPLLWTAVATAIVSGGTFITSLVDNDATVGKKQYLKALNEDVAAYLANPEAAPSALLAPVMSETKRITCENGACASDEDIAKTILTQSNG